MIVEICTGESGLKTIFQHIRFVLNNIFMPQLGNMAYA